MSLLDLRGSLHYRPHHIALQISITLQHAQAWPIHVRIHRLKWDLSSIPKKSLGIFTSFLHTH